MQSTLPGKEPYHNCGLRISECGLEKSQALQGSIKNK